MFDANHDAARLVHGESDGLPGVIADRYGSVVVLQLTSAGAERWRTAIVEALAKLPGVTCVYERSDAEVRTLEGLAPRTGIAHGELPRDLAMVEDGIAYRRRSRRRPENRASTSTSATTGTSCARSRAAGAC